MGVVVPGLQSLAKGENQFFTVIGELENLVKLVVNHPNVFFGIVGADGHLVRSTPTWE